MGKPSISAEKVLPKIEEEQRREEEGKGEVWHSSPQCKAHAN
jgi:hypothetical protein